MWSWPQGHALYKQSVLLVTNNLQLVRPSLWWWSRTKISASHRWREVYVHVSSASELALQTQLIFALPSAFICLFICLFFKTSSLCIVQPGLELMVIHLSLPPEWVVGWQTSATTPSLVCILCVGRGKSTGLGLFSESLPHSPSTRVLLENLNSLAAEKSTHSRGARPS